MYDLVDLGPEGVGPGVNVDPGHGALNHGDHTLVSKQIILTILLLFTDNTEADPVNGCEGKMSP